MRILVVQESDWLKRGPHQQHHLIERLKKLGHEIRIIDYEIDWNNRIKPGFFSRTKIFNAAGKVIDNQYIRVIRPPHIRAPIMGYVSILVFHTVSIIKLIKAFKPDVIIGMGILNAFLSAKIAKLFEIPFLYYLIDSLHTLIPERYLQPLGRLIEARTLKIADKILAINKQLGHYAKKLGASLEPEIVTAGIDKTRFNPSIDGKSVRYELEIQENEIVIFFMGWLYDFSGLREVARTVIDENTGVRLLILGRGDLQEELRILAAKSSENAIKLIDWVPYEKVPDYLSAADICILPAHLNEIMKDIVPIKLYEYLACGKPVIATKLPGIMREFGNDSGIVYVDSPRDVVEKAKVIYNDKRRYKELSDNAVSFTDSMDWERITERFLKILQF